MKLKEIREAYEDGTSAINGLNRQLAFAGIALVWLLKGGAENSIAGITPILLWTLVLFCASLFFDILQGFIHTWIWFAFYKREKTKNLLKQSWKADDLEGLDEDKILVAEKESRSITMWICWTLKVALTMVAYGFLVSVLIGQIHQKSEGNAFGAEKCDTIVVNVPQINSIKSNQEAIIKLLQPKQEEPKCNQPKKATTTKSTKKATKKQPLYLPLDTITCDGKEYMIVEKVK